MMDDDAITRLLLVSALNAHGVALPDGQVHQGLFSEMGAMVNHSCRPNLLVRGVGIEGVEGSRDQLQLVLLAVRDIEEGEELTISYLSELYLPFPERDERLRDIHGFGASRLATDPGLEALSSAGKAKSVAERGQAEQRVVAANGAAHDAWERAAARPCAAEDLRKQRMIAASHYAALLNENLLAETHAWRYNATWRLATLLAADGAPKKACAQALVLWESAMRSGLLVWPSDHWPEHQRLLRGARIAASGAGEEEKSERYARQLAEIEQRMAFVAASGGDDSI